MLGLVTSLGLMLALVHFPLQATVHRAGWSARTPVDQIAFENVTRERSETARSEAATRRRKKAPSSHRFSLPLRARDELFLL